MRSIYVGRAYNKMNVNIEGATFTYTLPCDEMAQQPLRCQEDFNNMIRYSERCARVFISTVTAENDVDVDVPTCILIPMLIHVVER